MKYEDIENILKKAATEAQMLEITFKTRSPIKGIFIRTADYTYLSKKNLWRIVNEKNLEAFNKSRDESLARIFNGTEFTRLKLATSTGT